MAEKNVESVNILGDTPNAQWKNAINVYRAVIQSNLLQLKNTRNSKTVDNLECITENVLYEMERLVDALFTEESEEDTEE